VEGGKEGETENGEKQNGKQPQAKKRQAKKRRGNLPTESTRVMKEWLHRHESNPYVIMLTCTYPALVRLSFPATNFSTMIPPPTQTSLPRVTPHSTSHMHQPPHITHRISRVTHGHHTLPIAFVDVCVFACMLPSIY
jgi:hypothetical protein